SASFFDLTAAVRWNAVNELVIRVGAHPGVLPVNYPAGTDFEKLKWTSGIYDSVSVYFADNPVIVSVQVGPHINPPEIVVQTRLRNYGPECTTVLSHRVTPWKYNARSNLVSGGLTKSDIPGTFATSNSIPIRLGSGEERVVTETIP